MLPYILERTLGGFHTWASGLKLTTLAKPHEWGSWDGLRYIFV